MCVRMGRLLSYLQTQNASVYRRARSLTSPVVLTMKTLSLLQQGEETNSVQLKFEFFYILISSGVVLELQFSHVVHLCASVRVWWWCGSCSWSGGADPRESACPGSTGARPSLPSAGTPAHLGFLSATRRAESHSSERDPRNWARLALPTSLIVLCALLLFLLVVSSVVILCVSVLPAGVGICHLSHSDRHHCGLQGGPAGLSRRPPAGVLPEPLLPL